MKTISALKKDLEFNSSLSFLIKTLKTIAVAQFRALEKKARIFERFLQASEDFLKFIDFRGVEHVFLNPHRNAQAVIVVTSDKGLLGNINMQVVAAAVAELEQIPGQLIVLGERGRLYAAGTGLPVVGFPGIVDEDRYAQAMQIRDYVIKGVLSGEVSYVKVVYPRPISFTVQRVEVFSLLPYAPAAPGEHTVPVEDVIMESSLADVVGYLVYLWMGQKLYEIFGLSRLAEFAARFMHLQGSEEKVKEINKKVRLQYFRVRHEIVDRTMREIFAGRLGKVNR